MIDQQTILDRLEAAGAARESRRRFLRMAGGAAAVTGGVSLLAACGGGDDNSSTPTPSPSATPTPSGTTSVGDLDVLNFALQLEYLEANYYFRAAFGTAPGIAVDGVGVAGTVTGGAAVPFTDTVIRDIAREIAFDEIAHVNFLRNALGGAVAAQPAINIAGDATGAFTLAARAAGVIGATDVFNPYASDENFLLGAYLLTDVGVSAYRGSAKLITNKTFLEASAGILATEAYHDAAIRGALYGKGMTRADLRTNTVKISDARDALDGTADLDQPVVAADGATANIVPTDSNGQVLGRTAAQVLNVVFQTKAAATQGGFFPSGVNGNIRQSAAN